MADYEKLGVFYLGREYDLKVQTLAAEPLLYDSKDLTTHGVCVGMTGSGKTGLCLALLEEAAIDGIPAIAIDPKGDLGNLLLTFPDLKPEDFKPWVDAADAARKGLSVDDYASKVAGQWRDGLAQWGEDPERIARFRNAVDVTIYTPGSTAGVPISVLQSFAPPPGAVAGDTAALRDRIGAVVSGLLGLLGIDADPLKSREHILLANILENAWSAGRALDLPAIIQAIQKPPFDKIGVFDLESFFPARDRTGLAMTVNNLLASPGFSTWMSGEALDIQRLLYTPDGKPRLSVISIAHLNDNERMFFVTLLLNETIAWMRNQSGTSSLRALLYMDEIFGFFPPSAVPPSKTPMLTLLKQARAFGLGIVLSTQNPVDLDYKGLSNAGTWFIGRLQTERDKLRVVEGLESALGGGLDRSTLDATLSSLTSRVFLMRNVHDDRPVIFQSRWALSYLRGPLTLPEIEKLMAGRRAAAGAAAPSSAPTASEPRAAATSTRPMVASDVEECFLQPTGAVSGPLSYRPMIAAVTRLHFADAKSGVDVWREGAYLAPIDDSGWDVLWTESRMIDDFKSRCTPPPPADASFGEVPAPALRAKQYGTWSKSLESYLQQYARVQLLACDALKLVSSPAESEGDFRVRITQALREKRDAEVEKLRQKFAPRVAALEEQVRRARERVSREQSQYSQQKMQSAFSIGASVLGAIFGSRRISASTISRAATAARSAGRIGREHDDVERAEGGVEAVEARLKALNDDCAQEVAALQAALDPQAVNVRAVEIAARKSDISIGKVMLAWVPWRTRSDGIAEPAFNGLG